MVRDFVKRLGIFDRFAPVICADDVSNTKPSPELFLAALSKMDLHATEAVVFEDSPNGVRAANAAGIYVVSVPNPITSQLVFSGENLRLESLAQLSMKELVMKINSIR